MLRIRCIRRALTAVLAALVFAPQLYAQTKPTIAQFLAPASPSDLVSAKKADRIAWIVYDRGMRNIYTAAGPDYKPVRLTNFMKDDGVEMTEPAISDDGSTVIFARGTPANREGWIANPSHDPDGGDFATWAVHTAGGPAWRIAEGGGLEVSPDGHYALYTRNAQIYRVRIAQGVPKTAMDTGGVPFIKEWGNNTSPRWSPDGSKIAFVSARMNHSLIGIYDGKTRTVDYISPSYDCDGSLNWFPDGKRVFFIRRPGTPFGAQAAQQGTAAAGAAGLAGVSAAARAGGSGLSGGCAGGPRGGGGGGGGGGRAGRGGGGGGGARAAAGNPLLSSPGLYSATFSGGYTTSFMVGDVTTKEAHEVWHTQPGEALFANINNVRLAGDNVVFPVQVPRDEWDRFYSISLAGNNAPPVLLTTTDGLIEGTSISPDGKTLYYYTNAGDIERRHIWAVSTSGGTPRRVTQGTDIEAFPEPIASGKKLAILSYGVAQPATVAIVAADDGATKLIYPTLPKDFPAKAHVTPQIVLTKAADGLEIHNQLFLPKDLKPGERRPALVFVHGGPPRQMLPGYHYMQAYTWLYAFNQYLADQGYVVISINYRSGIGYGRSFQTAPGTMAGGNSEYQDVVAGAKYLQSRPDVDPARVGIYGISYGGLLTAQALARNSDIFVAGADLAGVHLYGNVLSDSSRAYESSAIASIDNWKSPVMLWQADDDRNVDPSQTIGLIPLLRARHIYFELVMVPDDMHEVAIHSRMLNMYEHVDSFLKRFVWEKQTPPVGR
jgi:dipeptidyl-peptidase-4